MPPRQVSLLRNSMLWWQNMSVKFKGNESLHWGQMETRLLLSMNVVAESLLKINIVDLIWKYEQRRYKWLKTRLENFPDEQSYKWNWVEEDTYASEDSLGLIKVLKVPHFYDLAIHRVSSSACHKLFLFYVSTLSQKVSVLIHCFATDPKNFGFVFVNFSDL